MPRGVSRSAAREVLAPQQSDQAAGGFVRQLGPSRSVTSTGGYHDTRLRSLIDLAIGDAVRFVQ